MKFPFFHISNEEKINFAKNLAIMLKSGISIGECLDSIIEEAQSKTFKKKLLEIKQQINAGVSLSDTFAKDKEEWDGVFLSLVKAGETSGNLDSNLEFLADWLEQNNELRQEIKAATLYPKFVLGGTFLLGAGLSMFILPKLIPLFSQLKVELPITTRFLLAFSLFLQNWWWLAGLCLVAVFIVFKLLNKAEKIRAVFHQLYLYAPFMGPLIVQYQIALLGQLFATLTKSGFPIDESILLARSSATIIQYRDAMKRIHARIITGVKLSETLREFPRLFPLNVINIIGIGERSGTLEASFGYIANFYTKEVRIKTKKLPTMLEPLLLVFIAIAVGFVALSIIMPIYQLTAGINK